MQIQFQFLARGEARLGPEAAGEDLLGEEILKVDFGQSGRIWVGREDGKAQPARRDE